MIELLTSTNVSDNPSPIFEAWLTPTEGKNRISFSVNTYSLYQLNDGAWTDYGISGSKVITPEPGTLNLKIKLKKGVTPPSNASLGFYGNLSEVVSWGLLGVVQIDITSPLAFTLPPTLPSTVKRVILSACENFNDPNITKWDVSKLNSFHSMFSGCRAFNQDLSGWRISPKLGESAFMVMFENARAFNQDLSGWDVSHIPEKPSRFDGNTHAWQEDFKPRWGQPPNVG